MEAERRVRTAQPALLEAGPQTCEKMELLLATESWSLVEAEDMVNHGLHTLTVVGNKMEWVQGIRSV
jgi:hypothetical protein